MSSGFTDMGLFCQMKRSIIFKRRILFFVLFFLSVFVSCSGIKTEKISPLAEYKSSIKNIRTAIMPFENLTLYPDAGEMLRNTFYGVFSIEPFADIELSDIDESLDENGIFTAEDARKAGYGKIREITGGDILFFGKVFRHDALYLILYSIVTVELEIDIVDARNGKTIYSSTKKLRNIGGIFPTPPFAALLSIIPSPLASLINLGTRSFRLADWELCRIIVEDISLN